MKKENRFNSLYKLFKKLSSHGFQFGKMVLIFVLIFQISNQTVAVMAMSVKAKNERERLAREAQKPNKQTDKRQTASILTEPVKPAEKSEGLIPEIEKFARESFSENFGSEFPVPQIFGQGGQLSKLIGGQSSTEKRNEELTKLALSKSKKAGLETSDQTTSKNENKLTDTAISINAPVLNSGSIDGTLRVLSSSSFGVNQGFRLTEDLYAYGLPNITTRNRAKLNRVINERGDLTRNKYQLSLNGGEIDGRIHIRSNLPGGLTDYPKAIPGSTGTQNIEINSAGDINNIKDWSDVRSLIINASDARISIPPGNYESITLKAQSRIRFSRGTYNLTDTIYFQTGSAIEIDGETTINVKNNLVLEDNRITLAKNTYPDEVKLNVLGSTLIVGGKSKISASVRAIDANIFVRDDSQINGQVIAGSLIMNGGHISRPEQNLITVFGPKRYDRTKGSPNNYDDTFALEHCVNNPYTLKIVNGDANGNKRISSGTVTVNGNLTVSQSEFNQNVGYIEKQVTLAANNTIEIRLTSTPSTYFTLEIVGEECNLDVTPPSLNITSPVDNYVTTASSITASGTVLDEGPNASGVDKVFVNDTEATYNSTDGTWEISDVQITLGANTITVRAVDNADNETSSQITVIREVPVVDTTPPVVNIISPTDGATTEAETITVSGSASDLEQNATGLASVTVNGQNATIDSNGNWSLSGIGLNLGSNTITATATDNAGNYANTSITVTRLEPDTQAPNVAITSPADNSETTDESITVSGTVSDTGTNASGIASVTVNGTDATINGGNWTLANVPLSIGANTILVRAIDNAGNEATTQITVIRNELDTQAPVISISTPADNSETTAETITVSGSVSDPGANASGVTSVIVNGQNATINGGTWSIEDVSLDLGSNTISATATDNAGNTSTASVTVTRLEPDTQAPTVSITSPTNNSQTTEETITVSGTVADSGTNASGVATVTVNGQTATLDGNGNWTAGNIALVVGANSITVQASDNAGNSASAEITVTRIIPDTQAPDLTITSPSNNLTTTDETLTVSGTVFDTGANATGVAGVLVNGQTAAIDANGTWTVSGISLALGSNTITATASDNAGNVTNRSVTVTRIEPDTQAPTLTITSPANNFETLEEVITVQGTVVDEGSNATGVESVYVNGATATISGGTWSIDGVTLALGSNTIEVMATDNAGNTSNDSIIVTRIPRDTQAPTISIITPTNQSSTFDSQIIVSGTAIDEGNGATGVQSIVVNSTPATYNSSDNTWSATVGLDIGANDLTVVAIDNAPTPNQSQATVQVTRIAIQPPTVIINNPENGVFLSEDSITVAGTVSSNKPDMTFTVEVNGSGATLSGNEFTKTVNLTDGVNVITVVATDALGQQTQSSVTVTNDRTPPTVSLINVPPIVNPGQSYVIGANAFDAYGISDVVFTVDGGVVSTSTNSPYQFTLNIPLDAQVGSRINISATARDLAGFTAVSNAQIITTGPSGITGYVFDDVTGYVLPDATATLNNQTSILTDAQGLYSFISSNPQGYVLLSKAGYTPIERNYTTSAGLGIEIFDARLSSIDSNANLADVNGGITATNNSGEIQIDFVTGSFAEGTDIRLTSLSPQSLANLLPFGWSPVPGAIVDVRAANETNFSNTALTNSAQFSISQVQNLPSNIPLVLVRYEAVSHNWIVVQKDIFAGADGALQVAVNSTGQYAFLVADAGATAPPVTTLNEPLTSAASVSSAQLDSATASAFSSPPAALYSSDAKSKISFIATSNSKLPSGISIEAGFGDTYVPIIDPNPVFVDRPSQDFVLYSFPAATTAEPNRLGAFFVAKPVRTDFTLADLLSAKISVEIASGRLSQTGVLIGAAGGVVRSSQGAELEIPAGATNDSQIVFFERLANEQAGVALPNGYEAIGVFDISFPNSNLTQTAKIRSPLTAGDNSRIVVAKVLSIGGQQSIKVVGRVIENNGRLESTISAPYVPGGIDLAGIKDSGKYLFVRLPNPFGYIKGALTSTNPNTQLAKISNANTPFVDAVGIGGTYTIIGLAGATGSTVNQINAASLNDDATAFGTANLTVQDSIAELPLNLANTALSISAVTPTDTATNVTVTTPVTVTFNKPILGSTITGSNFKITNANGNPVISTITVLAGGRSIVLTPSATLLSQTTYRVNVSQNVKDIYGNNLASAFESTFTTTNTVTQSTRLTPRSIIISYPNTDGISTITIPANSVPLGSTIFVVNNTSGATVSTIAGSQQIQLQLQANVGDEIEIIIRQPDGTEYSIKQSAYRRADGFVSVSSNGGTVTSDDGTIALAVPAGAISGQANIKISDSPETDITIPRTGEMAPSEMTFIGGVKIEAEGNFTNTRELYLELPAPTGATGDQRALVMKPAKIDFNGSEVDVWESITSAKIENGKIKTTSPPFLGLTLAATLLTLEALRFYVFIPQRQRVVTGVVQKLFADGTVGKLPGVRCYLPKQTSEGQELPPDIIGYTNDLGRFALSHNNIDIPNSENVLVRAELGSENKEALAYPYANSESGLFGFESRFATITFPSDSRIDQPPSILIEGEMLNLGQGQIDTLRESGKVAVGSTVKITARVTPGGQSFSGKLIFNGSQQNPLAWNQTLEGATRILTTEINIPAKGSYKVSIEAQTNLEQPNTKATGNFNFLALDDPNSCEQHSGPPIVLTDGLTPRDGAKQVDVGTGVHIEFSEPVTNISSLNVFLKEAETGTAIDGTITSGGLPVNLNSNVCQIDFQPSSRLTGGKKYKLTVTSGIKDTDSTPNNLEETFNSIFETFRGTVITPNPIPDNSYKIAVLDDYIITVETEGVLYGTNGRLKIYDSSAIFRPQGTDYSTPIGTAFVPHRPIAITAFKDSFNSVERSLVAITTTAIPDSTRPNNVWFYDLANPQVPALVGVTSLSIPETQTEIPVGISYHDKRAYIGNVSFGGVLVVDIEQSIGGYLNSPNIPQNVVQAVTPRGGFNLETRQQRGVYTSTGQPSPVNNTSVIRQTLTEGNISRAVPVAYVVAPGRQQLISFEFDRSRDGLLDFYDSNGDGKDDRLLVTQNIDPAHFLVDLEAASQVQLGGTTKDIAVGISQANLFIFDVTNPKVPVQYQSRSFESLGLLPTDSAIQVNIEDSLVYVMFTDKIVVIDITNPANPYVTATVTGIGTGLRNFVVKDGFIYSIAGNSGIGQGGINVSIGRAVAQMVAYGIDPASPDLICGNPVVIREDAGHENEMAQEAGFFFQIFGHDTPQTAKVIVREVTLVNNTRTEQIIENLPAVVFNTTANNVSVGRSTMPIRTIDPTILYTAEIVLDEGTGNQLRSRQIEIPFSKLFPFFPVKIGAKRDNDNKQTGNLDYALAGNVTNVEFSIDGTSYPLYKTDKTTLKPSTRNFGIITDILNFGSGLPDGTYSFKFKATLKANSGVTVEKEGNLVVGEEDKDVRQPGSTVVNGVEVRSGNLAISEQDLQIKGRGLSLEFTRSYNSHTANGFNPLGYGWKHNYQIALTQAGADNAGGVAYTLNGGDGNVQVFLESKRRSDGSIPAEAPNLGSLVKNADGTFDYFTKSRVKYHFRGALTSQSPNTYLGNADYIEEPNGNRITFKYDGYGRLTSVTDASNRKLNFDYELAETPFSTVVAEDTETTDECPSINQYTRKLAGLQQSLVGKAWRIKKVAGTGGISITYSYDTDGNLKTVRRSGADSISQPTPDRASNYEYDAIPNDSRFKHLLKTVKTPNNSQTNEVTTYGYDLNPTNGTSLVTSIAMPEGISNDFSYIYGSEGEVTTATFTDGRNLPTTYQITDKNVSSITAPRGAVTQMTWTDFGQVSSITDPKGKTTTIGYDSNNNPSEQTVSGGGISITTYTTFDPKFSKMSAFRDGRGKDTVYEINPTTGNVDRITLPTNRQITFNYAPNGDLQDTTDQYGTRTVFSNYDSYGNPQNITKFLENGTTQTIQQTFDARSRQTAKFDNIGTNETYQYDSLDRQIRSVTTDPAGIRDALTFDTEFLPEGQPQTVTRSGSGQSFAVVNEYDRLQRLKKTTEDVSGAGIFVRDFTYDENSNLVTETNRRGVTTTRTYDELNFLTSVTYSGAFGDPKTVWQANSIDVVGNPTAVRDLYGNVTNYEYDGIHRLTAKNLPESVVERIEYDENNNITLTTDRNGKETTYEYDPVNRIKDATNPLGHQTVWTYDDAAHTVVKQQTPQNLTETVKMDGLNRPVSQTVKLGSTATYTSAYAYVGRNVTITDPRGIITNQKLSGFGEVGETTVQGANPAFTVKMFYSAFGAEKQMIDASNRVYSFVIDGFNRRVSASYNGDFSESWVYDGENLLTEHTDRRGVVSRMSYDNIGRDLSAKVVDTGREIPVKTTVFDDSQSIETFVDANSHSTTFQYDGLRRIKQITDANSSIKRLTYDGENLKQETDFFNLDAKVTKYTYDDINRVKSVTDRRGQVTNIAYNDSDGLTRTVTDRRANKRIETYDQLGRTKKIVDGDEPLAEFVYDGNNNRTSQKDGLNNETAFTYDNLDRLTQVTHPNNLQIESYTYDAVGNVKTYNDGRGGNISSEEYDSLNQIKKIRDGVGNLTQFNYDGEGLLLSKIEPKGANYSTTYQYNALRSLTQVTDANNGSWNFGYDDVQNLKTKQDALNRITSYDYDNLDRLERTTQPLNKVSTYSYDKNSNVLTTTDPKNQTMTYTYDQLDRVDTGIYRDSLNANKLFHDYRYDAEDNLYEVDETVDVTNNRRYTRTFDKRNRLTSSKDVYNKTVAFSYDAANNLKSLTDAGNKVTNYNYDAQNRLDTVLQNSATIADYDWYQDGLLQKVTYSANSKREYNYDNADRVTNITNTYGAGNESFDYGYDSNSNRETETRKINGNVNKSIAYGYDQLNRLTSAGYTANSATNQLSYTYDAVGNRKTETGTDQNGVAVNKTADYDALDRLTQLTETNLTSQFEYDDNSNLTKVKLNGTDNETFEYDVRNQLSKYTSIGNGTSVNFDYDFERKRLSKSVSGNRRDYVYAGNQVINEYLGNNLNASYGIGSGEVVRSDFAGEGTRNYFSDALGSITSLADTSSSLISRNDYDAFGEIVGSSGSSQNSITYTGQRLDVESGLMALGNGERYYNPSYGRFIQQDSYAGMPDMPQSLNRFAYTYNNPNKYVDPSGNVPILIPVLVFAGAFLLGVSAVENEKVVRERNEEFIKQGVDPATLPNPTITAVFHSAPIIGSGFQFVTGQNTITGEDLNWFWRGVEGVSTILDVLPVVGRLKGLRNVTKLNKAKQVGKQADEIVEEGLDVARKVSRAEDGAEKVAKSAKRWEDFLPEAQKIKEQTRQKYGFNQVSDQISLMADDVSKAATKIDSRLQTRLDAWKRYKEGGGEMNMKRWVKSTQGSYGNPNRQGKGYGKWISKQEKGVHGNSLDATGLHDTYVIRQRGTDQILHFGETGRGFETRGKEWYNLIKSEYGLETYVKHLKTVEGKRAARVLETKYIKTYEKLFGLKPGFTDAGGKFIQIQRTEH